MLLKVNIQSIIIMPRWDSLVDKLDISDSVLYSSYHQALNKMFEDKVVNWGRIIAMLCFTEALVFRAHTELMSPNAAESLIGWQVDIFIQYLQGWIIHTQHTHTCANTKKHAIYYKN